MIKEAPLTISQNVEVGTKTMSYIIMGMFIVVAILIIITLIQNNKRK
jgi:hypothetical protein